MAPLRPMQKNEMAELQKKYRNKEVVDNSKIYYEKQAAS